MKQMYIYDIDDFYEKWSIYMEKVKKRHESKGKDFFEHSYDTRLMVSLLSFYGLAPEQIIAIKLADVNENGIDGFDINFDEKSLALMNEYKHSVGFTKYNGHQRTESYYTQNTFIRSISEEKITVTFLSDIYNRSTYGLGDDDWIRLLFRPLTVRKAGMFDRAFSFLKSKEFVLDNVTCSSIANLPPDIKDGLYEIFGYAGDATVVAVTAFVKGFVKNYYNPRMEFEKERELKRQMRADHSLLAENLAARINQLQHDLDEMKELLELLK